MKYIRFSLPVLGALFALGSTAPLHAAGAPVSADAPPTNLLAFNAAGISASADAPSTNLLAFNALQQPEATVGWKNDSVADQWIGVSFSVHEFIVLDRITFAYRSIGEAAPGARVSLRIVRIGSKGSLNDRLQAATVLQTEPFNVPDMIRVTSGYLTFDITDIALEASPVSYAYILSFADSKRGRNFVFARGTPSINATALSIKSPDNFVFRSDDGGKSYRNLGVDNIPQLFLQGATERESQVVR